MVSHARDVHHPEPVAQGFLFQVAKAGVGDVLERAVSIWHIHGPPHQLGQRKRIEAQYLDV